MTESVGQIGDDPLASLPDTLIEPAPPESVEAKPQLHTTSGDTTQRTERRWAGVFGCGILRLLKGQQRLASETAGRGSGAHLIRNDLPRLCER
jgi:hypothetical protein